MKVLDRVGNPISEGDFVVYVTAGDRHPVLEFGWVIKFHESKSQYSSRVTYKIKLQRSTPDGTRITKRAVDVEAHWRDDTPLHIKDYRYNNFHSPTREEREEYYIPTTYRDTGKPDTTMLDIHDGNNNRLLVTKPV